MGCDIHSFAERRNKDTNKWEVVKDCVTSSDFRREYYKKEKDSSPFGWRNYLTFGFLAGVRYRNIEPISEPKGLPDDLSKEVLDEYNSLRLDAHSASYLTLRELVEFDYDKSCTGDDYPNETYRDVLNDLFFVHLEDLKTLGDLDDVRVVFWFDN